MTTRFGGEIELTPSQQATKRRWIIVLVAVALFRGTDFRSDLPLAVILVSAGLVFAVLILGPEPPE